MKSIIVDTGFLMALFRNNDAFHQRAVSFLRRNQRGLVTTLAVVTEVCHFLTPAGKKAFLEWIISGALQIRAITVSDFPAITAMISHFAKRDMDFADASLVWLGEIEKTLDILTLDRADFAVYRTASGKPFTNLLFPRSP